MLASLHYLNYVIGIVFNLVSLFTGTYLQRIASLQSTGTFFCKQVYFTGIMLSGLYPIWFFYLRVHIYNELRLCSQLVYLYVSKLTRLTGIMLSGLYSIWFLYLCVHIYNELCLCSQLVSIYVSKLTLLELCYQDCI